MQQKCLPACGHVVDHVTSQADGKMTELPFKVLVIGDSTVGKTSFTDRYTNNKFKGEYKPTLGGTF